MDRFERLKKRMLFACIVFLIMVISVIYLSALNDQPNKNDASYQSSFNNSSSKQPVPTFIDVLSIEIGGVIGEMLKAPPAN